jgi:GntR family transcriptional regulator
MMGTTWREIAHDLREAIRTGAYAPGARLPSRSKLVATYDVAPQTVVNAINILRAEGLVSGVKGSGWYVRTPRPVMRSSRNRLRRSERDAGRGTFLSDAHTGGWVGRAETNIHVEPANDEVAGVLTIEPGTPVLVRDRIHFADEQPVQLATSYFPRDLTEGTAIEEENTGPGGVYARLEEAGHILTAYDEYVRVRQATDDEAAQLHIQPGAPLFHITRIASTSHRAVEVNYIKSIAERYELHYHLTAE